VVSAAGGAGGAPAMVAFRPPGGGPSIETPVGPEALQRAGVLLVQDPQTATTAVAIAHPRAGTWTVEPLPGQPAPASVRAADGLPAVRVSAHVSGHGARRTLTWSSAPLPGQTLTFFERGAGGSAQRLLVTTRTHGKAGFAPSPLVSGSSRRIEVVVAHRGLTRARRTVARYRATPARPGRATRLRRHGLALSWHAVAGAVSYAVAVRFADGRVSAFDARAPRLRLPAGTPAHAKVTVTIVAVDAAGRTGPAATAKT
jgi:hypothetical protein